VALYRTPYFDPRWKNQEPKCVSLSADHHGIAAHLTTGDCEGISRVLHIQGLHVVEWQQCVCNKDEDTDCEDGKTQSTTKKERVTLIGK
jgi:hypothetical protein